MIHEEAPDAQVREKLVLLRSPTINSTTFSRRSTFGPEDADAQPTEPVLERHDEPTLLEVFFDLFFAANYAVFTKNQSVYTAEEFASHVGYFSMLWMTWLVICFYDVRFITDSVFERIAKGALLGVMVGFAVVAPNFNPSDQKAGNMRTMSLILMVSRLVIAVEYAAIAWHMRMFKGIRRWIFIQIGLCLAAAMVYLGVTFRFTNGNSRVFVAWYVVCTVEVLLTFYLSNYSAVMSFTKSHLMKRLTLLTVIILGDGIVVMAEKVVRIVKASAEWDSLTIGVVTAATAIVYFIFLIYFDWIREFYLPAWRQQIWTLLHFPFHLSLILWQTCFAQFIMWSKITNILEHVEFKAFLHDPEVLATATSESLANDLGQQAADFLVKYPIGLQSTQEAFNGVVTNVSKVPNDFWPTLHEFLITEGESPINETLATDVFRLDDVMWAVIQSALFSSFEIDLLSEADEAGKLKVNEPWELEDGHLQVIYVEKTWDRFNTVFTYGYIAIGLALAFMTILAAITRQRPWTAWPITRTIINFILSIGIGLIALLNLNEKKRDTYLWSHWLLPTVCIVQFFMLFITHVRVDRGPSGTFSQAVTFWGRRKDSGSSVEAQQVTNTVKYNPIYPGQNQQ